MSDSIKTGTGRVLLASLAGTTIEFFDFYIFATASVLVFPKLFFPAADPVNATLQSFATFALAFFARPVGAAIFGHFGDRIGRKATLVAALLTMGLATVAIGLLPTYQQAGILAPFLLCVCRLLQGLGLGGEWGGAVLLATENAPPGRKAWFGMFPQLGAPIGFIFSTGSFLILSGTLREQQFAAFGWRIPFVASAVLILIGLYVRLRISETPEFERALKNDERVRVPILAVVTEHFWRLLLGTFAGLTTFLLFYLMAVFALSWGTTALGFTRQEFLFQQMFGVVLFAAGIPVSAAFADRIGRLNMLLVATVLIGLFGMTFAFWFSAHDAWRTTAFLSIGFGLMGLTYGPIGTALAEPFPVAVRYTGASLAFNLAGIIGASLAPTIATALATKYGIAAVGYYLTAASVLTALALIGMRRGESEVEGLTLATGP